MFKIALGVAIAGLLLISTAPGCLVTCNPAEEIIVKPIEQIQAHPLTKNYRKQGKIK